MYVYQKSKHEELWTVGFYKPNGEWEPEGDYSQEHLAAHRVHFLNGGNLQVHEMHEFT